MTREKYDEVISFIIKKGTPRLFRDRIVGYLQDKERDQKILNLKIRHLTEHNSAGIPAGQSERAVP